MANITDKTRRLPSIRRIQSRSTLLVFTVILTILILWTFIIPSSQSIRNTGEIIVRDFEANHAEYLDHILILTPLKNAEETIPIYFDNLKRLTYPRKRISLGFLISDSIDNTLKIVDEITSSFQNSDNPFHRITLLRKDYHFNLGGDKTRHEYDIQIKRRDIMARSRSFLLTSTLTPEIDWVLWMDGDVIEYQPTLIQDLVRHRSKGDVIVPQCNWHSYNEEGGFDFNNWQETKESLEFKKTLDKEFVLVEGYKAILDTKRKLMKDLFDPKRMDPNYIISLDGVGGCCIIVKAQVHREGAIFPAFPIDHQVETEGFAQMAKRLGYRLIGLPDYRVFHILNG